MNFERIMTIATKNEKKSNETGTKRYNTVLPPARKEPKSHALSASVKAFLAKRESQERKKVEEAARRKEHLLSLRSQNSKNNKKAKIMASRTKDNDFSRIKLTEDELESKKKTDFELQRRMLTDKVERMKARIELEEREKLLPKKRKRKLKQPDENDVTEVNLEQENETNEMSDCEIGYKKFRNESLEMKKPLQTKQRKNPPNISFHELLKVASVKQHQPVEIEEEEEEEERPMTQKEKERYLEEKNRKKKPASSISSQQKLKPHNKYEEEDMARSSKQLYKDQNCKLQKSSTPGSHLKYQDSLKNEEKQKLIKIVKEKLPSTEQIKKSNPYKEKQCTIENNKKQRFVTSTHIRQNDDRNKILDSSQVRKEKSNQNKTELLKNANYKKKEIGHNEYEAQILKNAKYKNHCNSQDYFSKKENLQSKTVRPNSNLSNNYYEPEVKNSINKRNEINDKKYLSNSRAEHSLYHRKASVHPDLKTKDLTSHFKIKKSGVGAIQSNKNANPINRLSNDLKFKEDNSSLSNELSLKYKLANSSQHMKEKSAIQRESSGFGKGKHIGKQVNETLIKNEISSSRNSTLKSSDFKMPRNTNYNGQIKDSVFNQRKKVMTDKNSKNLSVKESYKSQDNYKEPNELDVKVSSRYFDNMPSKKYRTLETNNKNHLNKANKQYVVINSDKSVKKPVDSNPVPNKKRAIMDDLAYRAELMKRFENLPVESKRIKKPTNRKVEKYEVSDEDEDECDDYEDMKDFIDDDPMYEENEDYSRYIREIFHYDKRKYLDEDEDDDNMETSYADQLKEEIKSAKIGWQEDLEDMKKEEEEKKKLFALKQKRFLELKQKKKSR